MKANEVFELLELISSVDGRQIAPKTIEGWQMMMENVDINHAKEALKKIWANDTIRWVEPKHIIAGAREIRSKEYEAREAAERNQPKTITPHPICIHNLKVLDCMVCAKLMSQSIDPNKTWFELTGIVINEKW